MPTTEGSYQTGWLILFTADETRKIAQPVGDYGGPVAAVAALVLEPAVSKIIGLSAAALTFFARKAVQEDRLLGLYVRGNPLRWLFSNRRPQRLSDLLRNQYAYWSTAFTGFVPFVYDGENPQSLESWRRAVGV